MMVVFKQALPWVPSRAGRASVRSAHPSDAAVEIRVRSLIWWITIIEYNLKASPALAGRVW